MKTSSAETKEAPSRAVARSYRALVPCILGLAFARVSFSVIIIDLYPIFKLFLKYFMIYTASSPFTSRFQTVKMSKPASVRYPLQGNLALFGRYEVQYPAAGN